jgi:hypothetical protein
MEHMHVNGGNLSTLNHSALKRAYDQSLNSWGLCKTEHNYM